MISERSVHLIKIPYYFIFPNEEGNIYVLKAIQTTKASMKRGREASSCAAKMEPYEKNAIRTMRIALKNKIQLLTTHRLIFHQFLFRGL